MIKLGFANHPRQPVVDEIRWIARSGFDFVDLCLEPDAAAVENIRPETVRAVLDETGLSATGHMAYYLPIGSPMAQLRQAAITAADPYLAAFAAIGVSPVTVHSHWPPSMFEARVGLDLQIETLRRLVERTRALGIELMYEPVGHDHDTPDHLAEILAAVPGLLCHLDIGHCNTGGRNPGAMLRRFGPQVRHLHLHDNDGRSDLHLPPGTGCIDWPDVVAALREIHYAHTATIEVFARDRDYVLLALKRCREWFVGL